MIAPDESARYALRDKCNSLAQKLWLRYEQHDANERILIAVSGIPGAGKSTVSQLIVDALDAIRKEKTGNESSRFAVNIPMDGFHYTRAHLKTMPQPEIATHRRGAAFTYDAEAFCQFVNQLRTTPTSSSTTIYAPSFDHAIKDPKVDDIEIHPESRVVLIEGNYCALNREPWLSAARLMDELWFIEVDREVARHRLAKRHVASGICPDLESAYDRIETTDFLNADDIVNNLLEVQEVIRV